MEAALPALPADDEAMRRVAAGDVEALAPLFDRHRGRLFAFLYHMVGERALAEDLLGEAFLRVYRARGRYRPGGGFEPWLYAIARNLARSELRRRAVLSRLLHHLPEPEDGSAWSGPEDDSLHRAVREALRALPEEQRTALVLREFHGLTYAEIGRVLGCREEAARARAYRGRTTMRAALAPRMREEEANDR